MDKWIPVAGPVVAAAIGTLAALFRAHKDAEAKGNWEKIKILRELRDTLPEDDSLREWMGRYARIMIMANCLNATRFHPIRFVACWSIAGVMTLAGIVLHTVIKFGISDSQWVRFPWMWIGFSLLAACFFIPIAPTAPLGPMRSQINHEVAKLHREVKDMIPNEHRKGSNLASDIKISMTRRRLKPTVTSPTFEDNKSAKDCEADSSTADDNQDLETRKDIKPPSRHRPDPAPNPHRTGE